MGRSSVGAEPGADHPCLCSYNGAGDPATAGDLARAGVVAAAGARATAGDRLGGHRRHGMAPAGAPRRRVAGPSRPGPASPPWRRNHALLGGFRRPGHVDAHGRGHDAAGGHPRRPPRGGEELSLAAPAGHGRVRGGVRGRLGAVRGGRVDRAGPVGAGPARRAPGRLAGSGGGVAAHRGQAARPRAVPPCVASGATRDGRRRSVSPGSRPATGPPAWRRAGR